MSKNVVIVGGGISGLIAANILNKYADVILIEPNVLGGEFLSPGLKYIHKTEKLEKYFDALDVVYSSYNIEGGILLNGKIQSHPAFLKSMDSEKRSRVHRDFFMKTRSVEVDNRFIKYAMNDPVAVRPKRALRCYIPDLIDMLSSDINIVKASVRRIFDGILILSNNSSIKYDYLVLTIPLWITKEISNFDIPDAFATNIAVASIVTMTDYYDRWDYIYTPYTPCNCVYCFSINGDGCDVEMSGHINGDDLHSDLNFLFREGWDVSNFFVDLKGYLLPLEYKPVVPDNVALIGRYAKWNFSSTIDVTLTDVQILVSKWFNC